MNKQEYIKLILSCLIAVILYFPSLLYGFSQDDFTHLFSSEAKNWADFFNFFNPYAKFPDIFYYRPLTTQVYFFINTFFFGLNPLPPHLASLFLHLCNIVLFYFIVAKIWKNKQIAFLSALFYGISSTHFLSLYYLSAFQQIGKNFFIFLSILTFLKFKDNGKKAFYVLSLLFFIGSLLSKESALILPVILIILESLRREMDSIVLIVQKNFRPISPYVLIGIIYVVFRIPGFYSVFNEGSYDATFSLTAIIQNIKWYFLWAFGLPEILESYPGLRPDSLLQFTKDFSLASPIIVLFLITVSGMFAIFILSFRRISVKQLILSGLMFLIGLSPVLILNQHRYAHYLDLSLLGFLPVISLLILHHQKIRLIQYPVIFTFVMLQIFSLKLTEQTHWTTHRAKIAEYYRQIVINQESTIPQEANIIFLGTKKEIEELSFALAKNYAVSVWLRDKNIKVDYSSSEINKNKNSIVIPVKIY